MYGLFIQRAKENVPNKITFKQKPEGNKVISRGRNLENVEIASAKALMEHSPEMKLD